MRLALFFHCTAKVCLSVCERVAGFVSGVCFVVFGGFIGGA